MIIDTTATKIEQQIQDRVDKHPVASFTWDNLEFVLDADSVGNCTISIVSSCGPYSFNGTFDEFHQDNVSSTIGTSAFDDCSVTTDMALEKLPLEKLPFGAYTI